MLVRVVVSVALLGSVCEADLVNLKWKWDGFNMKKHKSYSPVDIRELGVCDKICLV